MSRGSQHPDPMTLPSLSRLYISASWEEGSEMEVCQHQADRGVGNKIHLSGALITGPTAVRVGRSRREAR